MKGKEKRKAKRSHSGFVHKDEKEDKKMFGKMLEEAVKKAK